MIAITRPLTPAARALAEYLRDPKNKISKDDSVERHQEAVEKIWMQALKATSAGRF